MIDINKEISDKNSSKSKKNIKKSKEKIDFIKNNMNIIEYERYDENLNIIHKNLIQFKIGKWKKYQTEKFPIDNNELDINKNHSLICGNYDNKKFPFNIGVIDIDVKSKDSIKDKDIDKFIKETNISPFQIIRSQSGGVHIIFLTDDNDQTNNNKLKSGTQRKINTNNYKSLKDLNIENIDICGQGRLSYYIPTKFRNKNEQIKEYTLIYETPELKINSLKKMNEMIDKHNPDNLFKLRGKYDDIIMD